MCVVGHEVGRAFTLGARTAVIGRAADATISLSGDDISRHHASISLESGRFVLDDLGSSNGTLVNGVPVTRHVLAIGDRIQIGESATLLFTRQDNLEERALQLQRLDTLGHLAGGLAHDFGNLINVIVMAADNLQQLARGPEPVPADELARGVSEIQQAAASARAITQRILCFSRTGTPSSARLQLASIVERVRGLLARRLEPDVVVRVQIDPALTVRGDAAQLEQVLMNLCLNARDAMPHGGRLELTARALELSRHDALELHLGAEGSFTQLIVRDTGVGMDAATQARIFEPFFSTKPAGRGTGLGLFSAFGIVRTLGGAITVTSELGRGATFEIMLPRG